MAIQQRGGADKDFDANKMLPREIAITTDGTRKVYVAFAPGDVKELASTEEVQKIVDEFNENVTGDIEKAKEEVEKKKEEVLKEIPDYEKQIVEIETYKANSILCNASGTTILTTDSAKAKPNIKPFGKSKQKQYEGHQLFDISQLRTYGSQVVVDDNDWVTVTLDNTNGTFNLYQQVYVSATDIIEESKTYFAVCEVKANTLSYLEVSSADARPIHQFDTTMTINPNTTGFFAKEISAKEDFSEAIYMLRTVCRAEPGQSGSVTFRISVIEDLTVTANTFVYEPFVGGAPSPSLAYQQKVTPIGDGGSVEYGLYGGNLLDYNTWKTVGIQGGTAEWKDNGLVITPTGTNAYTHTWGNCPKIPVVKGMKIIMSASHYGGKGRLYFMLNGSATGAPSKDISANSGKISFEYTVPEGVTYIMPRADANGGANVVTTYKDVMITANEVPSKYSEYVAPQLPTYQTPNGLHGIPLGATIPDAIKNSPIHMSGVYWDEVEQRYYISDTRNENGKDVQRILVIDNPETRNCITDSRYPGRFGVNMGTIVLPVFGMSNRFKPDMWGLTLGGFGVGDTGGNFVYARLPEEYTTITQFKNWLTDNETKFYLVLAEPIITDVCEEDQTQYDSIHMNYPNTTIVNDAGAYMEVEYVADTKEHIKQNYTPNSVTQDILSRLSALESNAVNNS